MRLPIVLLLIILTTPIAFAQAGASIWDEEDDSVTLTPPERDRKPNWDGITGMMCPEHPLRETLQAFASRNNIGFLLDRRVDPGMPLSLDLKQVTVREVFEQAAAQCGLGFCELDTVAYLGPPGAAELLQLLLVLRSDQLAKLPKAKRDAMLTRRHFRAELYNTPIETLQRLAGEIGFDGTAFDRLPHDVWPEIDFPNESTCTVFSLLLMGFDQTLAVSKDATKLAAMPIPRELVVTREYKGPVARQLSETELLAIAPDANITPNRQGVGIEAPLEQLAKIEMLIAKRTTAINAQQRQTNTPQNAVVAHDALTRLQDKRFTVPPFSGSLDKTLTMLAEGMQLELIIDEQSFAAKNVKLDTRISTGFEQATVTEAFEKCLAPIGAKFRIEGETVTVYMD